MSAYIERYHVYSFPGSLNSKAKKNEVLEVWGQEAQWISLYFSLPSMDSQAQRSVSRKPEAALFPPTNSYMVWHQGLGSFSVYLVFQFSLGNSTPVCSVVEYLYPVLKCRTQSIYLFLHAALRNAERLVALGPLQLFRRVIIVLPSCLQKMEVFLELQFGTKRATAGLFNWPPSGEERAAAAPLISHDQCQLSAWHGALGPQSLLITWVVTMMDVVTRHRGVAVTVHLWNLHHSPQSHLNDRCTDLAEQFLPCMWMGLGLTLQFHQEPEVHAVICVDAA